MAVHPGLADDLRRVGGDDAARIALYNCAVCSKLFTKEAYLLRHMEMKLDSAHAVGLEQLKKSSSMFRSTTDAPHGCLPSASYSVQTSVDHDDGVAASPGAEAGAPTSARYTDDELQRRRRSTSCVSPMSVSSRSPASPPPSHQPSFVPAMSRDDPTTRALPQFASDAVDVLHRYPHPISGAAAAAAAADYHLRRGGAGMVDVAYSQHGLSSSYRGQPTVRSSPSAPVDDDVPAAADDDSSSEADDVRSVYSDERRRHSDYFRSTSPPPPPPPAFNRLQPYVPSAGLTTYRSHQYSFYQHHGANALPPPPPHLSDTYLRRSGAELDDRASVHGFR